MTRAACQTLNRSRPVSHQPLPARACCHSQPPDENPVGAVAEAPSSDLEGWCGEGGAGAGARGERGGAEPGGAGGGGGEEGDGGGSRTSFVQEQQRQLRHAASLGRVDEVKMLLQQRAHPSGGEGRDAHQMTGLSPLHVAANAAQSQVVAVLLEAGANVNAKMFFYSRSPAQCAAAAACDEALKAILAAGGAVRVRDKMKLTLLHDAARGGAPSCIDEVLKAGAGPDIDARDKWGRTPLFWCVLNGHTEAARALVDAGAKVDPGKVGRTDLVVLHVNRLNDGVCVCVRVLRDDVGAQVYSTKIIFPGSI